VPEGPSIVILKEATQDFVGKIVEEASGNSKKVDFDKITGQRITAIRTFGKQLLICFKTFTIRIHLLMFGSYRINEAKEASPRLHLKFKKGELNFYACSVKIIEQPLDELYDWTGDVMNSLWDPAKALEKLKAKKNILVCDALLDQNIFAGVGNIIKNEVLFRLKIHPESYVDKLPPALLKKLVKEAVHYSFEFFEWKKAFVLRQHWLAHNKSVCPRDHIPFKRAYLGKTNRRSFYCTICQHLYR
jgi:endonuclease VIII